MTSEVMIIMMLRQIQHFQAVVQENSFTEAAEVCHISQSGISQSIRALEEEIGVQLMIRKNRRFELTEAGEYFYKKSLVLTADLAQLCRETARIDRKDTAQLRLGILSTYGGDEFHQSIAAFSEKYPAVEIIVIQGNHEDARWKWMASAISRTRLRSGVSSTFTSWLMR